MPQSNKAYVTIASFQGSGGTPNNPRVTSSTYVVSTGSNSGVQVGFSYGDSDQAIRQAIADAIRSRESDSSLDVNFV